MEMWSYFHSWDPYLQDNKVQITTKACLKNGTSLTDNSWVFGSKFESIENISIVTNDKCVAIILDRSLFNKNRILPISSAKNQFVFLDKICILESIGPDIRTTKTHIVYRDVIIYQCGTGN